jgi:ADP-heptose:LPS heptosyltransferase
MRRLLERIEWGFRHAVVYPFFRLLFHNKAHSDHIELSSVRSLLILRFDKIGDMIVTKPIFRILKRRAPALKIGVVTSPSNAGLIEQDDNVYEKYIISSKPWKVLREMMRARKERYDVVLNFIFNRTTSAALIANFVAPRGIKVGQGEPKYAFYFNKMLTLPRSEIHMVEILSYYVSEVFNIQIASEELDLFYEIDESSRTLVQKFLKDELEPRGEWNERDKRYVVFNISAREKVKSISFHQASGAARYLAEVRKIPTVVIFAPEDLEMAFNVTRAAGKRCVMYTPRGKSTFAQIAALLEKAACVVTPDTSIVHLASAVKVPVLVFFSPVLNNREWLPFRVPHDAVFAGEGAAVSSIPVSEITRKIDSFVVPLFSRQNQKEPV